MEGKYVRQIAYWDNAARRKTLSIDVYDVLKAFDVRCPAIQHAVKKLLCAGLRGHKDASTDLREAIASIERACEMAELT